MYIPRPFALTERQALQLVKAYPFATVTTATPMQASHIPLLLRNGADGSAFLEGHMAKANPHTKTLDGSEVLCIFHGPHAYISGEDYVTGPAVPTWNYVAVHVYGKAQVLNTSANQEVAKRLLAEYDADYEDKPETYQPAFIEKLANAIVSFQITIDKVEGKAKLGQNKRPEDQAKTLTRLKSSEDFADLQLGSFIEHTLPNLD